MKRIFNWFDDRMFFQFLCNSLLRKLNDFLAEYEQFFFFSTLFLCIQKQQVSKYFISFPAFIKFEAK
jgi:hypothetical protein